MTLWTLLLIPVATGILCLIPSSEKGVLRMMIAGVTAAGAAGGYAIYRVLSGGPVYAWSNWLFLDALSAYHLGVMLLVYILSSFFAWLYFGVELEEKNFHLSHAKMFCGLWCAALAAMTLIMVSNNIGIMWIGVEATTLLTAFLIRIHLSRYVLEAMWKYMIICSVGIAFAFMGTILFVLAMPASAVSSNDALLWTHLVREADKLSPALVKAAYIFLLVGYGTKAGLAPMHNWLPDAHSKAPAPVSALFSGFMLNASLYCIMRYLPVVDKATGGSGWPLTFLMGFGALSIIIAAAFILFQRDLKRLLAYHSVEHLGIITLGLGLGGIGTFGALFHTLNHSLCKTLSFFAAGRLGQIFGTQDMHRMKGGMKLSRVWGIGILASLLALIGIAPFSLFMSEFQILKAAVDGGHILIVVIFLLGTASVFVGALAHAIPLAWGQPPEDVEKAEGGVMDYALVMIPLVILLVLGVWMPSELNQVLQQASSILKG